MTVKLRAPVLSVRWVRTYVQVLDPFCRRVHCLTLHVLEPALNGRNTLCWDSREVCVTSIRSGDSPGTAAIGLRSSPALKWTGALARC